ALRGARRAARDPAGRRLRPSSHRNCRRPRRGQDAQPPDHRRVSAAPLQPDGGAAGRVRSGARRRRPRRAHRHLRRERGSDSRRHARCARRVDSRDAHRSARRRAVARRRRAGDRAGGETGRRGHHARRRLDRQPARAAARRARYRLHGSGIVSAVSAPADRRFRRAHVKPARKRGRWQAIVRPIAVYIAAAMLLCYATYRATIVAARAHVLQVDRIAVRGNERLSKGEVIAVLNGLRGENIVSTDLERWRRRLLASPWVRDAALRRSLPSTIDVLVWEREPIGVGRIGGDVYLVDDRGVIIDQYGPQYADLDLPIIDGLGAAPNDAPTLTDEARADLAARVIGAVKSKPKLASRLSQVDVSDLH